MAIDKYFDLYPIRYDDLLIGQKSRFPNPESRFENPESRFENRVNSAPDANYKSRIPP